MKYNINKAKRLIDLVGSLILLILLSPILSLIALIIWVTMGRPIFFIQERPGLYAKPFKLVKFRTMRIGPGSDAERLTKLGRFLRRWSIDELPELWNVLKGDMSLVGPRPLFMKYLPYYTERERLRFQVRPGITGLAQISGRNLVDWDQRLELDAQYAEKVNLLLDIKILAKTVIKVLKHEGIALHNLPDFDILRGGRCT